MIRKVEVREKKEKNTSHRDAGHTEGKRRLFGLLGFIGFVGFVELLGFVESLMKSRGSGTGWE